MQIKATIINMGTIQINNIVEWFFLRKRSVLIMWHNNRAKRRRTADKDKDSTRYLSELSGRFLLWK